MSDFYYCISGSNDDIVSVQDNMWPWMSTGVLGPKPDFTGSFASKSIEDYSPVWDEAKRCQMIQIKIQDTDMLVLLFNQSLMYKI